MELVPHGNRITTTTHESEDDMTNEYVAALTENNDEAMSDVREMLNDLRRMLDL